VKLVHLVGFIRRIYHDVRSPECRIRIQSVKRATPLEVNRPWGGGWSYHSLPPRAEVKNNNNNMIIIYLLQLGCHPVAVVILHVYKT